MSKFSQLLGRLEEQAIRIHALEQEQATERAASRQGHRNLVLKNDALREEVSRLSQPRDPEGKKARAYDELHRMALDAHSLIERDGLTDAEKVKSIHGLIDQVIGQNWFAGNPHLRKQAAPEPSDAVNDGDASAAEQASPSPKPTRRTTKKGLAHGDQDD